MRAIEAFQTSLVCHINIHFSLIYNKEKKITWLQSMRNEVLDLSRLLLHVDSSLKSPKKGFCTKGLFLMGILLHY